MPLSIEDRECPLLSTPGRLQDAREREGRERERVISVSFLSKSESQELLNCIKF